MRLKLLHNYMGFPAGTEIDVSASVARRLLDDRAAVEVERAAPVPSNKMVKARAVKVKGAD